MEILLNEAQSKSGSDIARVETFAQFGVVFLLFALGLEFTLAKVLAKAKYLDWENHSTQRVWKMQSLKVSEA
ncbi:hypothetical protein ABZP36_013047 [Zizania latifolia]